MIHRTINISTVEYIAAAVTCGWGLWLLVWGPPSIGAAAFAELRATFDNWVLEPHSVLGLMGISVGLAYAAAVTINGRAMHWTPFARLGANSFNSVYFASLSYNIAQVQPSSTGVYTYAVLALISFALFHLNLDRGFEAVGVLWERIKWNG